MDGLIVLAGGDEFRPGMIVADSAVLARIGLREPRVAILPAAAAREAPEIAARHGVDHFRALGADAHAVMILDRASADDDALVALLSAADLVYMAGGDPVHLASSLAGSKAHAALRAMLGEGRAVGGSSAGAMVMCERMRVRGQWHDGLGLVRGVVVLPHYQHSAEPASIREMAREEGVVFLGIPGGVVCLGDGDAWEVAGRDSVAVIRGDGVETHKPGWLFRI